MLHSSGAYIPSILPRESQGLDHVMKINITITDDMATQKPKTSTAMLLTWLYQNIPAYASVFPKV